MCKWIWIAGDNFIVPHFEITVILSYLFHSLFNDVVSAAYVRDMNIYISKLLRNIKIFILVETWTFVTIRAVRWRMNIFA